MCCPCADAREAGLRPARNLLGSLDPPQLSVLLADVALFIVTRGASVLPAMFSLLLFSRREKRNCQNVPDAYHRQKALLWPALCVHGAVPGKRHCVLAVCYARSDMSRAQ